VARAAFVDGECAWEIVDFAPRIPEGLGVHVPLELVRLIRPLRGHARLTVRFDPRPDYARASVELRQGARGIEVVGGPGPLHLETNLPVPYVLGGREFALTKPTWFVLSWGGPGTSRRTTAGILSDLEVTVAGWRQ
jgi:hypothetical protein